MARTRDVLEVQATPAPDITDHVLSIPVGQIELGERLRPVDQVWAAALGQLMLAEGQLTPIEVCRLPGKSGFTVVSGGHRRVGAEMAGLAYLKAIVVTSERAERRMREISENLMRKGLDPLDRAAFVGDMHELLRARDGVEPEKNAQSVAAAVRWQKAVKAEAEDASDIVSHAYGWTSEIAEQLGLSKRAIERSLVLRRRLSPADIAALRNADHPVIRNGAQLLALAKLDERERGEIVGLLVDGRAKTVAEGVALRSRKPKPSPEAKALSAFIGSFNRMSLTEKKGALVQLAGLLTPSLIEAIAEAIDLPARAAPLAPDRAAAIDALRGARLLTARLLEGGGVDDDEIEAAHDACEQALHGCGPATSNDRWEIPA